VYPLDLVKTRMQVEPSRWASAAACFSDTLADSGVPGLYAGMGAQMVGVAPEKSFKARRTRRARRTRVCSAMRVQCLCAMRLALRCADAAARA
jgi:solute carrier family 25 aspartate/glutamate transporter 12/13